MKGKTEYFQPDTLEEAKEILKGMTEKSVILAGGTDLLIKIREKRPEIDRYLSLYGLNELKTIEIQEGWVKIGAMVTHTQAAENIFIQEHFRALSMACSKVGSQQVRNKGTLAGNIMNGSPAGDIIPCIWSFRGELEFLGTEGYERVNIRDYLKQGGKRSIGCSKILTAIYLPFEEKPEFPADSCFIKLGQRDEVTIAQISVCTVWKKTPEGKKDVQVVLGAVDTLPADCACGHLLEGETITEENQEKAACMMKNQIRTVREKRTRQPKLKLTEAEKKYKERAVRGLLYDVAIDMNHR